MMHKPLVVALLGAIGLAAMSDAGAATHARVQAQSMGKIAPAALASRIGLDADASLSPRLQAHTAHGTLKTREQQTFRGVSVYGRNVVVEHDGSGNVLSASGEISQGIGRDITSVTPAISGARATALLRTHAGLLPFGIGVDGVRDSDIQNAKSDLYVYAEGNRARLAYVTSFFVDRNGAPTRPMAIIDANTGEVIQSWEGLTTKGKPGGGGGVTGTPALATGAGGNLKTGQYFYGTDYAALAVIQSGSTCYMQNPDVKTNNMASSTRTGTLWSFICPNSSGDAANGAYSPINDAHHFGSVVHDMYNNWLGAPPLSFSLVMNVHYGRNYENAFWNGSSMNFGDGASYFYPLTSLDVTSHEISHGFTEQNSNLQYSGQSGGMNEAFSDMAGEAAEYFDRGSNDWLVGAEIIKNGTALRWMCTPTLDGRSIDNAANFTSSMDVHYSSGVYNKAFCTLAKSSNWNTKKAFEVFAHANAMYWTATSTFNSGACGVETAADDYGYSRNDVVAAFNAVGVTCQ
ncbi:MAG TPA: M4 family metallopeptidase [Rhodanobacter sp.]